MAKARRAGDLSREEKLDLLALLEEKRLRVSRRLFHHMFPDADAVWLGETNKDFEHGATIYAREKYAKHLEFFEAGAKYRERCFLAANRVSKTMAGGAYETTCHLTGLYPHWWKGRRFAHPIRAWACGDTNETTRDVVQATLLGELKARGSRKYISGTGVIPYDTLGPLTWKQGVQDLVDRVRVRHVSGGWSVIAFKSYQQGRRAFEGTAQHVIWDDEEPPMDVYGEQLIRTGTTDGLLMLTFTPLLGMSEVVQSFLPSSMRPSET